MTKWFGDDGAVQTSQLNSWDDLREFLTEEQRRWSKRRQPDLTPGAIKVIDHQLNQIQNLNSNISNFQSYGQSPIQGVNSIIQAYNGPDGRMIGAGSSFEADWQTVAGVAGESAAVFRMGFLRRVVTLADATDPQEIIGALWDIAPNLAGTAKLSAQLRRERASTRKAAEDLQTEALSSRFEAEKHWRKILKEAAGTARRWAARRNNGWRAQAAAWEERLEAAEASIKGVEAAYREQMGLKAPVEYWKLKATAHEQSEGVLRLAVIAFFVVGTAAVVCAFWTVGWGLINLALQPNARALPSGVYIVASAGLASTAGLVFWAGRLLTKLYLSQHHLAQDAAERATMTETYLALIENSAADTADRQVILNALFRTTPDGIVKEDGGLDPSIAAALGKFLAKP